MVARGNKFNPHDFYPLSCLFLTFPSQVLYYFSSDILARFLNDQSEAGVAQLVEYKLPKLGVAGSSPVARSNGQAPNILICFFFKANQPAIH